MNYFKFIFLLIPFLFQSCIPDRKEKKQEEEIVFPEEESEPIEEEIAEETFTEEEGSVSNNDCYNAFYDYTSDENRTLYDESQDLYNSGDYQESLDVLKNIYEEESSNPEVLLGMGNAYIGLEEYDNAIFYYNHAISFDGNFFLGYANRGMAYYYKMEYDNAIADLRKSIQINPDCSISYFVLGEIFIDTKNYKRGCKCMKKARKIADDPQVYKDARAWLLMHCSKSK